MAKQENITLIGTVTQELGNSMFRVEPDMENIPEILCTISGKIRKHYIKILVGDQVEIEVSPYDLTRGRIKTRLPLKGSTPKEVSNNTKNKKK